MERKINVIALSRDQGSPPARADFEEEERKGEGRGGKWEWRGGKRRREEGRGGKRREGEGRPGEGGEEQAKETGVRMPGGAGGSAGETLKENQGAWSRRGWGRLTGRGDG